MRAIDPLRPCYRCKVLTKTAGLLVILSLFVFACGKEEQAKTSPTEETSTSVATETTVGAAAEEVNKNLLVMQYYALPG